MSGNCQNALTIGHDDMLTLAEDPKASLSSARTAFKWGMPGSFGISDLHFHLAKLTLTEKIAGCG